MILVNQVTKSYQIYKQHPRGWFKKAQKVQLVALQSVSFTASNGQITALLGPNGAGKTTLLRLMAGLEQVDQGNILIDGKLPLLAKQGLTYLSDGCGLYNRLSAYENIRYFAHLYSIDEASIQNHLQTLDTHLNLMPLLTRKVSSLSLGERMRIALARAMIHQPHTIILDEPTNGLDLRSVRRLRTYLQHLASPQGGSKCILFSTHHMHEVEKIAEQVIVIADGRVQAQGSVIDIIAQASKANLSETVTSFEDAFAFFAFKDALR